jgi:hypothetical protein
MADETVTEGADAYAGHKGNATPTVLNNPANKAPADQVGYDPTDSKWAELPGHAARLGGHPRAS